MSRNGKWPFKIRFFLVILRDQWQPGRCLSPPKVCNKQMIRAVCIRLHCKIHREIQSFLKIKGTYSDVLQRYFKYPGPFIFREGVFNMT